MTRRSLLAACIALAIGAGGVITGQSPAELCLVTYNIKHGRGMDDVVDLKRTAAVLRLLRPDVVGLQEVDERATRSGSVPQAERLGQLLGMQHAFGKFMDFQGGAYGMAVLSRFPIVRSSVLQLPEGNEPRVAIVAEIRLPDETMMAVVNVHFDWVQDDRFRFSQAELLSKYLDSLTMPYVLLGDFNDVPASRTLSLFRARATEAAKPAGENLTFSSTKPDREIDYVFFAPASAFRAREVRVIDERLASDHRPVLAVLERRPSR